jgi:predicted dehydrogenase
MPQHSVNGHSRREFLQRSGQVAAATAVLATGIPHVHAAEKSTIQVALVGCGGRGTGAAQQALSVPGAPTKLVAMADVFADRLKGSHKQLSKRKFGDQRKIDVPEDRRFVGFDGYKNAMDCLNPGDVVILATPPAFRWVHFAYAIEKGLNVFMEKPVTVDGPTSRRMLELAKKADAKNLKVGVGLMCRHCDARKELFNRIQDGEIGDILLMRAYRMHGRIGNGFTSPAPADMSELLWQVKNFHGFLWTGGGIYSDFLIHNIDECCWMKNSWPVEAKAIGGRHYRGEEVDQNFDVYAVEYTFDDGSKLLMDGRCMPGCHDEFASYAHGTKGSAVISSASHTPAKCRTYRSQRIGNKSDLTWAFPQPEPSPYQLEWNHLIDAIQTDQPYNEVPRGVEASVVTSMGRMAAHTGRVITFEEMLNCDHEFAPDLDKLTMDSPAPLAKNSQGKYPVPMPGIISQREY